MVSKLSYTLSLLSNTFMYPVLFLPLPTIFISNVSLCCHELPAPFLFQATCILTSEAAKYVPLTYFSLASGNSVLLQLNIPTYAQDSPWMGSKSTLFGLHILCLKFLNLVPLAEAWVLSFYSYLLHYIFHLCYFSGPIEHFWRFLGL